MKKKVFAKEDINLGNEIILNNFEKENLDSLIKRMTLDNLIVIKVKQAYILIQKFSYGYEMDIINKDQEVSWQNLKHDEYSLKFTLHAMYQAPEIRDAKFYYYKYKEPKIENTYIKIIDMIIKKLKEEVIINS